ncbi:hypothetical protein ACA910_008727 [Epithemia clementina (nom. ined.)]
MLQYDNSAFYFFAMSILSFYLLPSWYYILSSVYQVYTIRDETIGAVARTSAEKEKAERLKKDSKRSLLTSRGFLWNLGITIALTALFIWLVVSVSADGQVNSFDPYKILEIDLGADNKAIKKAYRKLSLLYHPDKNPGDRAAEAKFVMVSKAYEALTDETARENYEKFGNPDGRQNMQVSIGLPAFLLDASNKNLVLVGYLIFMVGIIPYGVYTYYSDSSQYGEKNVMYDTYAWFHYALSEHTLMKALPEIFAGSAEFRKRNKPTTAEQKQSIAKQTAVVKQHMLKPKYLHPVCVKGNVLMHSHLLRQTSSLTASDASDLKFMLQHATELIDAMISVCKSLDAAQTAVHCIEFGQYVTQALWVKDSPLLQLPHYGPEEVKHCENKNGKKGPKVSTIEQYMAQEEEERKGMATFTDEQKADVRNYLKYIYPDVSVTAKIFTEDDEDDKVYEGDVCTIRVSIARNQWDADDSRHKQQGDLVHAPLFPFPKREAWWVILAQIKEGKIMSIEKVSATRGRNPKTGVVHHDIKLMAPPKGRYEFDLVVKSNGYVGADKKLRISLETLDNSTLPEYKIHPEDAELDDEPTLFEQMLNDHVEQDSDDEDDDDDKGDKDDDNDDDDKDDEKKKLVDGGDQQQSAAVTTVSSQKVNKKRAQLRNARNDDDDDDDDDDEVEDVTPNK